MNTVRKHLGSFSLLLACAWGVLITACGGGTPSPPPPPPPPTIITTSLPDGANAVAYNQTLTATGGTGSLTWSLVSGSLPAGLSLSSTGAITGTPTATGTFSFTVQVQDSASPPRTATQALALRIVVSFLSITTTTLPDGVTGQVYNSALQATGGIPPRAWSLAAGSALPGGLSLSSAGVISGLPNSSGTSNFTVQVQDAGPPVQSVTKPLSIRIGPVLLIVTSTLPDGAIGQPYNTSLTAFGGIGTLNWSLASGSLPAGLTLSSGGVISGTPAVTGVFSVTVQVQDSANPPQTVTRALTLRIVTSFLSITTTSLPDGVTGQAYSATLQATGGVPPVTWSLAPGSFLPPGLSLDPVMGTIAGTPTASGAITFVIQAKDAAPGPLQQTAGKALVIRILALLVINTVSLPDGTTGQTYNQTLQATGGSGPRAWSVTVGALPAGLSLALLSGVISGTPTTAGMANFTVQVRDTGPPQQTASQPLSINVIGGTLAVATTTLPAGTVNNPSYIANLSATGGTAPFTWGLAMGSLPDGLSLSAGGAISGTPTTVTPTPAPAFTVQVQDSSLPAKTATQTLSIRIAPVGSLGRNDTIANATPLSNGAYQASISPLVDPPAGIVANPDVDVYKLTAAAGAIVAVEITAQRLAPSSLLDSVIEIVDGAGTRLTTCRTPSNTTGLFNEPCMNDDISSSIKDSRLELQVPATATTFYVRVLDFRGDARPDLIYTITLTGAN